MGDIDDIPGLDIAVSSFHPRGPAHLGKTRWKFSGAETVVDNKDLAGQRRLACTLAAEMNLDPSQDENPWRLKSTAAEIHLPLVSDISSCFAAMSCLNLDLGMELCQRVSSGETHRRAEDWGEFYL